MDLRKLKTLIDLVSDSNVTELEITDGEGKVKIVKASPVAATTAPVNVASAVNMTLPAQTAVAPVAAEAPIAVAALADAPELHTFKSPMVGTFYSASSPEAKPFVEIGSQVTQGQAICIIEAMKILNEVEVDKSGTVRQILAKNGQAVEYGQPLFVIE
jgi:acetyl-CoA carboxylase biotin carboxyl carrier protein